MLIAWLDGIRDSRQKRCERDEFAQTDGPWHFCRMGRDYWLETLHKIEISESKRMLVCSLGSADSPVTKIRYKDYPCPDSVTANGYKRS